MNRMNRVIKNVLNAVLFLAVVAGGRTNVGAAEPQTGPQPRPRGTVAKVIMVDPVAKAITVDIHGTIHLLWFSADVKVRKAGEDATIADIVPGQMVNFVTKKTARGDGEVVAEINIESSDTETEAAGGKAEKSKPKPKAKEHGKSNERPKEKKEKGSEHGRGVPPIFTLPAVTRPPVSPHH
jgi:hypothetical protein